MSEQLCGKSIRKATNGVDRGTCTKPTGHRSSHSNRTCYECGVPLSEKTAIPYVVAYGSGSCRACNKNRLREMFGYKPMNVQTPGAMHTFPCGCTGILPAKRGQSNKFAHGTGGWRCRISDILHASSQRNRMKIEGYVPIDFATPHSTIRALMAEPNCWRCDAPLNWNELGHGKTPHLHHNNVTGEIYGFTCAACNPRAEAAAYDRLYDENARLKLALRRAGIAA